MRRVTQANEFAIDPLTRLQWWRVKSKLNRIYRRSKDGIIKILDRFGDEIARSSRASEQAFQELGTHKPVIAVIDALIPDPQRDSGSLDALNYMRIFTDLGWQVVFMANDQFIHKSPLYKHLHELGVLIVTPSQFPSIEDFIKSAGHMVSVYLLSRVHSGGRHLEYIREHNPNAKIIFNTVDLHHVREIREAQINGDEALLRHAYRTQERELSLVRNSDATIVVSEVEKILLRNSAPTALVFNVPLIREVPGRLNSFEKRRNIGFIGSFLHTPNSDAVRYFLDEIWPGIHASLPDTEFHVMGANIPKDLLTRSDAGYVAVGHVKDVVAKFEMLRLTVAPLRFGAGAKGKIITSLSLGVPCIASDIAVEGMQLDDRYSVAVARSKDEFISEVVRLYRDENEWERFSTQGIKLMAERNSIENGKRYLSDIISQVMEGEGK